MEPAQLAVTVIVFLGVSAAALYRHYRGDDGDDGSRSPPTKEVRESTEHDGPTVEVSVTSSKQLLENTGRAPEQTVARYLAAAFDDVEYNYRIRCGFSGVDPPAEGTVGSGTPDWWRSMTLEERTTEHAQLLLVDQRGGGGTYGSRAVVGAGGIDEDQPVQEHGEGPAFSSIHAALHEVGHILQVPHDLDDEMKGKQHTGEGWNEGGKWHYTPMNVDNDVENSCGKQIPKREHDERVHHVRWTDCTAAEFDVGDSEQGQLA